ncbi:MAG: hypothetical protein FWB83_00595 [Treponema sp.]|nr:hypothetical protein [Treponema sp.]
MNKRINFEDTIFILNVRIKMIRDLIRLDTEPSIFYRQTMSDLEFISSCLDMLSDRFLDNLKFLDREIEADNILDAEWQLNQIINEISGGASPFAPAFFPDTAALTGKIRKDSQKRQKQIEESYEPAEHLTTEPVVSNAELNGLLGSM